MHWFISKLEDSFPTYILNCDSDFKTDQIIFIPSDNFLHFSAVRILQILYIFDQGQNIYKDFFLDNISANWDFFRTVLPKNESQDSNYPIPKHETNVFLPCCIIVSTSDIYLRGIVFHCGKFSANLKKNFVLSNFKFSTLLNKQNGENALLNLTTLDVPIAQWNCNGSF